MITPNWILPLDEKYGRGLASFENDTLRAELGPRRVARNDNGNFHVVTPEEAFELEQKFINDWKKRMNATPRQNGESQKAFEKRCRPDKSLYVIVDNQARHFPKVWKLYELRETGEVKMVKKPSGEFVPELDDDGNEIPITRFVRIGEADDFDAAVEALEARIS